MSQCDSRLGFLFPGQGSQSVGMLSDLALVKPSVLRLFDEASEILDYNLWSLIVEGPAERLNATVVTQPAMLVSGVAVYAAWCEESDIRPAFMAGHSLGEYTALVCSGALAFKDAVKLVAERARLMQAAVPEGIGAMAAIIGLQDDRLITICEAASSGTHQVCAANFNAPGQVVIAGHHEAVVKAAEAAKAAGARKVVMLPVSVPSHCPLMGTAASAFRAFLDATPFHVPAVPVIHNVDVLPHGRPDEIRAALQAQLCGSVRWVETIRAMISDGVDRFIECGPGSTLKGLNKRIVPDAPTESIADLPSMHQAKGLFL
ncbi:MAG: ACP S-malonyltransferase [Methylococcus sp.]